MASPGSTPTLGRYVPTAILFAIAFHALLLGVFYFLPSSNSGGGGQVLGQLSVSLGGSGAAGPVEQALPEPVVAAPALPPVPRVDPQARPIVETIASKPRVDQAQPIVRRPAEVPRVSEVVQQTAPVREAPGDQGDGEPVGTPRAGAPSLGEGAVSQTVGIGVSDADAGGQRDAYLALLRARIEQNRTYPSAARRRREEGMATLKITIDGQGRLSQAQVIIGSGSFHLDRAAKRMVEKSGPFPSPPTGPFTTTIPIVFALR